LIFSEFCSWIINEFYNVVLSTGLPMNELEFSSYPWCHQDNLPHEVKVYDVLKSFWIEIHIFLVCTWCHGGHDGGMLTKEYD
jgi:hypothetical protein